MKPFGVNSARWLASAGLVLLAGASVERAAFADPTGPGCANASDEPRQRVSPWPVRMRSEWTEVEGQWHGRWLPAPDGRGHFHAAYVKPPGEHAAAELQFTPTSENQFTIVRTQAEGTCTYEGTVNPDGWHVRGTYTCSWAPGQKLRWSAAIGKGYQPPEGGCAGSGDPPPPDPRLQATWHEQEGDWIGTWTPVAPEGDFRAGWHKGREWTNANLHMTIAGDQVTIIRSQAEGRCTYIGNFVGNGWSVGGTYRCAWTHGPPLHWSARIGDGQPPE